MSDDSYVPVRDEPRHRRRFEDEWVRIYDVLIPPGDTTLYHHHTEDTYYVAVNEATVVDRTWGEAEARSGTALAGSQLCRPHRGRPLIHQVHNAGAAEMRLIGAEIKATPAVVAPAPLEAVGHELVLERERLRAYEATLEPDQSTGPLHYGFAGLTIFLTTAVLQIDDPIHTGRTVHTFAAGDVIWRPQPVSLTLTNVGESTLRFALGEWR